MCDHNLSSPLIDTLKSAWCCQRHYFLSRFRNFIHGISITNSIEKPLFFPWPWRVTHAARKWWRANRAPGGGTARWSHGKSVWFEWGNQPWKTFLFGTHDNDGRIRFWDFKPQKWWCLSLSMGCQWDMLSWGHTNKCHQEATDLDAHPIATL